MHNHNYVQEFIALEQRRCQAEVESDVLTLESLLDDDFIYIHVSGTIDSKDSLLASREVIKFATMTRQNLRVHVSDDLAVLSGGISFQAQQVGSPDIRIVEAHATQVLARRGDKWKYLIHQATLLKMIHKAAPGSLTSAPP